MSYLCSDKSLAMNIFKRKLYDEMLQWKEQDKGATALLIKGARRVGKSTIAEDFAKREYESYILIDFVNCSQEVRELWDDISDLNFIFLRLQVLYGVSLKNRHSVIVFDEVQFCPHARQAIKYLVKDGRYDYIETGSLLSIRQNVKGISIPSEEKDVTLYPMDYEEFQWALGNTVSVPLLKTCFEKKMPLGDGVNRKMMRDFRLYMLVGGMPQAVNAYLEFNDLAKVDEVKRNIINLYEADFYKIDPTGNASKLFHAIPGELNRNASRYFAWKATDGTSSSKLSETLAAMQDSMVVNMAYHANDPSVGLSLHCDYTRFKMFMCDTGLFVTLAFWDKKFTENIIYTKLLSDKLSADLGYVYENVIAQTLKAAGHELYYYTFPSETSNHLYEIDFLLTDGDKIIPIEVKSGNYRSHASLDAFCKRFSSRIRRDYIIYTKDLRKEGNTCLIPAYMTMFL